MQNQQSTSARRTLVVWTAPVRRKAIRHASHRTPINRQAIPAE